MAPKTSSSSVKGDTYLARIARSHFFKGDSSISVFPYSTLIHMFALVRQTPSLPQPNHPSYQRQYVSFFATLSVVLSDIVHTGIDVVDDNSHGSIVRRDTRFGCGVSVGRVGIGGVGRVGCDTVCRHVQSI